MDLKEKAASLVAKMTLKEKAKLLFGQDFWHISGVPRLGLSAVLVTDGPHGLRKQPDATDFMGINGSLPATCFPTASAVACTFDDDLITEMGQALGEECRKEEIAVLLGPGINIKRSPLCGRNFEYLSEDPLLSARMGIAMIKGVQSRGVGTSLKHFAGNSQEKGRLITDSIIDPRALREIYLKAFEMAVREAQPWTVMTAYNLLNGVYCSENEELITGILRGEWGFDGITVTDWGAMNEQIDSYLAGLDVEMPGVGNKRERSLVSAVKEGRLPIEKLDAAARRVTELLLKAQQGRQVPYYFDQQKNLELALRVAEQSAVLLKNDGILPCHTHQSMAVIGAFAKHPRYQGTGSSKVNPVVLDNALAALTEAGGDLAYAPGYDIDGFGIQADLIEQAVELARSKDIVLLFAGLPEAYECEGFDRSDIALPDSHNQLIEIICEANPNTIVILQGGSAMAMPWNHLPRAILLVHLGGCQGGHAIANLVLGVVNPGGKLAETFPLSIEDNFCASIYPATDGYAKYPESIFVGYRYYDTAGKKVLYPFGHGLSYTTFDFSDLSVDQDAMTATCKITNTGSIAGSETAQLYVAPQNPVVFKAQKELKAYRKVKLKPGESARIEFTLTQAEFVNYSITHKCWTVEAGVYEIQIGASSRDIRLREKINLAGSAGEDLRNLVPAYYDLPPRAEDIPEEQFAAVWGGPLSASVHRGPPYTMNTSLAEIKDTWIGKLLARGARGQIKKAASKDRTPELMIRESVAETPFRQYVQAGISYKVINGMILMLNGHFFRGLLKMMGMYSR